MKIDLNAKWAIETEEMQVVVCRKRIAEKGKFKGKMVSKPMYYYNNMEDALLGLVDRDINGLEKVQEIVERVTELKSDIKNMLKSSKFAVSAQSTTIKKPKAIKDTVTGKGIA